MPFPIGSLITAAGGLLSGGLSTLGNLLGANQSFKMQQKLAAQQFDYNKQLMKMQQDYNNPANQISMYRSAGINPYAILGNNTSVSSSSVGQGSAPNLSNIGTDAINSVNGAMQSILNTDMQPTNKQVALATAQQALTQSNLNNTNAAKVAAETDNQKYQNDILQYQSDDLKKQEQLRNDLYREQIANTSANTMMAELQATNQHVLNSNQQKIIDQQLAVDGARIELMRKEGKLNTAQASAAYEQALKAAAERNGVQINNDILKRSANKIVNQNFADAVYKHYQAGVARKNYENYETDKWFNRIGSALGGSNQGTKAYRNIKPK